MSNSSKRAILAMILATSPLVWWLILHEPDFAEFTSARKVPAIFPLPLGRPWVASLATGEAHTYSVSMVADQLLHLAVDQDGVDVVLSIRALGEEILFEADSPNGDWGTEEVWWAAPQTGAFLVEVRPWSPAPKGTYRLRDGSTGRPQARDLLKAAAWKAIWQAERARTAGEIAAARHHLISARDLWRTGEEGIQEALTEVRLAELARSEGDSMQEIAAYRTALELTGGLGERRLEVNILLRLGESQRRAGDFQDAWITQLEAEQLAQSHGLLADAAAALAQQADLLEAQGETRAARSKNQEALQLFRRLGAQAQVAATLHNLGVSASLLGLFDEAERNFREELEIRRAAGDSEGQASTLAELGWNYRLRGFEGGAAEARGRARELLEEALGLSRSIGDSPSEAGILDRLGTIHRDDGRWAEALSSYRLSQALLPPSALREMAHSLNNQAELHLYLNHVEKARSMAAAAAARFSALPVRDVHGELHANYILGRAAAALGDLNASQNALERTLDQIESLRAGLDDQTLTLPFFALRQTYFEGAVDAQMSLAASRSGLEWIQTALETTERARMRTLLESLTERRNLDRGVHYPDSQRPLSTAQIQSLLDDETVLLDYAVGEESGYLWILDRGSLTSYPIPGRRTLAPLAKLAYRALSSPKGNSDAPGRLAHVLIGPLEDHPGIRRLAIITDGFLAYIPFAALPWGAEGNLLFERFEIVRLPSATTLAALRWRAQVRPSTEPTLAVLADPVFSPRDERVRGRQTSGAKAAAEVAEILGEGADLNRATEEVGMGGLSGLERLPSSRREAEAIAALFPGSYQALDFSAERAALLLPQVRDASILHFATHSLLNPQDPALSGIVLSLVDQEGLYQEGFLRADEIIELGLSADLVVLSACKTGLGPEVRGEGLQGLARAFLAGGARRVVVSLWSVDDRSTADLMQHFYGFLLQQKLPPAAALREAQLAYRRQAPRRFQAAAYWAGFEVQGDWR